MNRMHSFSFRTIGNLARNAEVVCLDRERYFTRLCLVSNDFVIEDPECRSCVTTVWFIAVGDLGDELPIQARKGDQLIVEGVVLEKHWTDQNKSTEANKMDQEFIFLVTGYAFGARRQPPGTAAARVTEPPPQPRDKAAAEVATVAA